MKKICAFIAVMALLLPSAAYAADTVSLYIDDSNVYDGMDKAYKDGYSPLVANGAATLVLPLLAEGDIKDNTITATLGLGDTNSSPFVYSNYQKTIALAANAVSGGATVNSYLVRFDLPLAAERYNGVYPVTVDIAAQAMDDSPIQQSFTTYVTIADGKDPNAPEPTPAPEKRSSQPKIIVSSFSVNPSPVMAGEEFTATVTLENTSASRSVKNMTVNVSCESPDFVLQNETSTLFISKLAKGKTIDIELKYSTDLKTPPQRYNIMLSMEYDNYDAEPLSSSGTVSVEVKQPLRVEMEAPKLPESVNAGDTMPISLQVMNMGRSPVYNVRCELEAPGLIPSKTAFIGNMEAGTAMTGEMDVFVGTKDMTEGYEGEDKYGFTSGQITLLYEDENGKEFTATAEIQTLINPPVIAPASNEQEEEPEKVSQWWISLIILGAVAAAIAVILITRKKGRRNEDI